MNKKAENKNNWLLLIIAIIVLFLLARNTTLFSAVGSVAGKSCSDPDGNNIFTTTIVKTPAKEYIDACYQGRVYEKQCAQDGTVIARLYSCPPQTACLEGSCRGVNE